MWNKMLQSGSGGGDGETTVNVEKLELTTRLNGTVTLDLGGAYKWALLHIGNVNKGTTTICVAYDAETDTIDHIRSATAYSPIFDAKNGTITVNGTDSGNSLQQVLVIR